MEALEDKSESKGEGAIRQLLAELFSRLDDVGISYCVLRNYEGFPDRIGHDIDMLVLPEHVEAFENCFFESIRNSGWTLLKRPKRFGYRAYWIQLKVSGEFIHFDIWSLLSWKGLRWADENAILESRRPRKQFYIPDAVSENCILFIKDLVQSGAITKKYLESIKKNATEHPISFYEFLRWGMGKDLAEVLSNMARAGEWEKIEGLKGRIRCAVLLSSFLRNPVEPILGIFRFLFRHLWSIAATPNGLFVALIGPDGSGKSTVAKGLMQSLGELYWENHYFHGHFGIIPELRHFLNLGRRLLGRKPLPPALTGTYAVQNVPPHGKLRAITYALYYSIDYILGYWIIKRAHAMGLLVVFDRYFYDYFMQDLYKQLPRCFLKPLVLILPRPDLVIYLQNTPEIIHQRKPELSVQQIERQCNVCESILNRLSYAVAVSTDLPIQDVIAEVSQHVLKVMERHQRGTQSDESSFCHSKL